MLVLVLVLLVLVLVLLVLVLLVLLLLLTDVDTPGDLCARGEDHAPEPAAAPRLHRLRQ